ncbi:MAG: signal peptidase II [Elusimicrobiota bacterium]|nr:signal peptidase II [Elusimicrobiota bacterium]
MRPLRFPVVLVLLALDRATKVWAMRELAPVGTIPLLPFFDLTYVENTGAAFGLGRGGNGFFVLVSVGLTAALVWMMRKWPLDKLWLQWGGLLVVAGALGNLYDRVAYAFVVDFLHLHRWPVFNVADSCISVGACLLAWGLRDEEAAEKKAAAR